MFFTVDKAASALAISLRDFYQLRLDLRLRKRFLGISDGGSPSEAEKRVIADAQLLLPDNFNEDVVSLSYRFPAAEKRSGLTHQRFVALSLLAAQALPESSPISVKDAVPWSPANGVILKKISSRCARGTLVLHTLA